VAGASIKLATERMLAFVNIFNRHGNKLTQLTFSTGKFFKKH
jgi:hypothetical protein